MAEEVNGLRATQSIPLSGVLQTVRADQHADLSVHDSADTNAQRFSSSRGAKAASERQAGLPGQKNQNTPEVNLQQRTRKHRPPGWTPDRGQGYYHADRERRKRPSLVETGEQAGNSRVLYTNRELMFVHSWLKDSFISALNTPLKWLALGITIVYLFTFFFFAAVWWGVHKADPYCIYGINGFAMAYNFSLVTQQTIGYGNSGPNDCYWGSFLITVQTIVGLFLDSVTLGIIFARISHPKNRGRTIGISDSAVISRRDGILKLMFRIADFRDTQVVEPAVKAFLYTWGKGRTTAEGEHIPARVEQMDIHHIDGMLLLPIIIEHTIDERSPLCGHTYDSLTEVEAEIVVTFEGTTEMGNPFMARQSYLPTEIHWGHQFCTIIRKPKPPATRYLIEIEKFHDVEPMPGLEMMPPGPLSRLVVTKAIRTVPYPLLGENTLVLSDSMVVAKDEKGQLALMFRIGDTYPTQHLEVQIRAYLYRWHPRRAADCGKPDDCEATMLEIGYEFGDDRILLWLPWIGKHVINADSPLANWLTPSGFLADADSCIAVTVEGYMYVNSQNRMRMRIYNVLEDVKQNHAFESIITPPSDSPDFKPRVDWTRFHNTRPLSGAQPETHKAGSPKLHNPDPTLALTSHRGPASRISTALSQLSFTPDPEAPQITSRKPASDAEQPHISNGSSRSQTAWEQQQLSDGFTFPEDPDAEGGRPHYHRSAPPESAATMLTPWNDPESSFAQRPVPPSTLEHSVIFEGDEGTLTSSSRNSLTALARSSAASLRRAFSSSNV